MKKVRVVAGVVLFLGVLGGGGLVAYVSRPDPQASRSVEQTPRPPRMKLQAVCSEPVQSDDMESTQVCTFGADSFAAVYEHLRQNKLAPEVARLLVKTLPQRSLSVTPQPNDAGVVGIGYDTDTPEAVLIEIRFEGGVDRYRLARKRGQVSLEISQSAD